MNKIVIDRDIPFIAGVLERYAETIYLDGASISAADIADADAMVVRTRTRCDAGLLEGSTIRAIATATIGYDHIDMDYCRCRGIEVATSKGCNARGVLQWVGAVLSHLSSRGRITDRKSTVIGVVGVGNVGSLVADYASRWGFEVLCCDPLRERSGSDGLFMPERFAGLDEIVRRADIVTLHVPLEREGEWPTFGMADERFFEALKPGAVLLNSSRGEVVDQDALLRFVEKGVVDAIIDTWAGEPDIPADLARLSLLATPHIAGYSMQGKAMATAMAVRSLARCFGWESMLDWFPEGEGLRSVAVDIGWDDMCRRMPRYFDIAKLSDNLKAHPANFEQMRNTYVYREEFF